MSEEKTPTQQGFKAWDDGLPSTANPYPLDTVCWGQWIRAYNLLGDEYMALAVET